MDKSSMSMDFTAAIGPRAKSERHATTAERDAPRPWAELLSETVTSQILPRLISQQRTKGGGIDAPAETGLLSEDVVAGFVDLIIADDIEEARAIADRVIVHTGSREALLDALLTPAARLLGLMWEQDLTDFVTVTLGVYRLDQIMKETSSSGHADQLANACEHHILLLPVPGEQHGFGLGMVADAFREGGWCVHSGPSMTRAKLLTLVRHEWFDVIGFSVASERWLKGLSACIRAVRGASCNKQAYLMAGGPAIANQAERTRFLGVDATATDAREALSLANVFVESIVTAGLRKSSRLIDFG